MQNVANDQRTNTTDHPSTRPLGTAQRQGVFAACGSIDDTAEASVDRYSSTQPERGAQSCAAAHTASCGNHWPPKHTTPLPKLSAHQEAHMRHPP